MGYKNLKECISDLQRNGLLKTISEEVDPDLDIASIHLDEFQNEKKVLLFQNVKGSRYRAVSNLFGTLERTQYLFRDTIEIVKSLVAIKAEPISVFKRPIRSLFALLYAMDEIVDPAMTLKVNGHQ